MTRKAWLPIGLGVFATFFLFAVTASVQEIVTVIPPPAETIAAMEDLFAHEPSHIEIQNAAMRYAEVHPDKIESWHQGAMWGALLPQIRLDLRNYTDIYEGDRTTLDHRYSYMHEERSEVRHDYRDRENPASQERGGTTGIGDWYIQNQSYSEDLWRTRLRTRTRESDELTDALYEDWRSRPRRRFTVLFTWLLGDFLFSREQLYISREAKDLARLRQNTLDELAIHWFDRRRAQIELMFSPPSRARSRIDLQFRIARLTASIDALTGGYLSKNTRPLYASQ